MNADQPPGLETDPRFPSGPWVGFYLLKPPVGKQTMELRLVFQAGQMTGEGRDPVGEFLVNGQYDCTSGKCHWIKKYLGKHNVFYEGYNEGKGIWGLWKIDASQTGGFHIWPEGFGEPTDDHLVEEADLPASEGELLEVGAGASER